MRGRKKSDRTRAAILRCASEVFSERSFHEVLIEDISHRLGVGKGTLYRYFRSKEELYFATIVDGMSGMGQGIEEVLRKNEPLENTIEGLANTVIGYFWERRDFFVLFHRHESKLDPKERKEWQERREEVVLMVAARLSAEMRRRGVRGVDPRLAVEMLFGMIRAVCMYRDRHHKVEDLARLVTRVFFAGVLPTGDGDLSGNRRPEFSAVRGGQK